MNRFFITGTLVEISEKSTANGMLFTRITVEESGATTFTDGKLPYFQILIIIVIVTNIDYLLTIQKKNRRCFNGNL